MAGLVAWQGAAIPTSPMYAKVGPRIFPYITAAGLLVPVLLDRLDQDPAVASSVFVTMITDSMGFFAFLGLAVATGLAG